MRDVIQATVGPDLGVDLGTANTVIFEPGRGAIINEPSVVCYDTATDRVIAVGAAAKEMDGRAPGRIRVVHPLRFGTISDFGAAHTLVSTLVDRALASRRGLIPRFVTCVPGCATDIECKAVEEAFRAAGARRATFVSQGVAAAVGAGLDVAGERAQMVVDIGGGTTEIAVLAFSGVVALHSIKVGGDTFDAAISARLRNERRFIIGILTAERLKMDLGYAGRPPGREPVRVAGRDLASAGPSRILLEEDLVGAAMAEGIDEILRAIVAVIESLPPDLASDLIDTGITMTGGGALISGIGTAVAERLRIPVVIADDPLLCVARGAGEILRSPGLFDRLRLSADRFTRWYQSLRIGMRESYSR